MFYAAGSESLQMYQALEFCGIQKAVS